VDRALIAPSRKLAKTLGRVRQVWEYLVLRPKPEDLAWVDTVLTPAERALYDGMSLHDQAHTVKVARKLATLQPPDWAIKAALLHDVGKPRGYGLIWRVLVVLRPDRDIPAEPRFARRWPWALQIYRWHGLYGAEMARAAGVPEAGCRIILEHSNKALAGEVPWLREFQWADE
jgi:putative nucleotidyltransferase with HDIG domain